MRPTSIQTSALLAGLLGALLATQAEAGPIMGPTAQDLFDGAVSNSGYTLQDFQGFSVGTPLTTQIAGLTFESHIGTGGAPQGPHPVNTSATFGATTIVGRPCGGCSDDGRVGYRILFSTPQAGVGIERLWNSSLVTRFYTPTGQLLHEFSGVATDFFAYFAETADQSLWVGQVEMDGNLLKGSRQVGYADNLIYGTALIPEPSTASLLSIGLVALATSRARRSH